MRNPDNLIELVIDDRESSVLPIDTLPEYNIEDYDLMDEKDMKKFIQDVERAVRGSFEYRQMINYLRDNMDMNKCSFLENVSNASNKAIKIEIHHEPVSLYDICVTVFNKRRFFHETLRVEMVAKEVMYLHYRMMVGLIPLAETVHELVHNQYLFVPTDKVYGHYKAFIDEYRDFLPEGMEDTLQRIEEASSEYSKNTAILNTHYIYLDTSNAYNLPTKEEIETLMRDRINEIKSNNNLKKAITRERQG